ncbi:MAG: GlmU family protein [Lentimicrobiaceae bacterium]|nr:GlmU family protein [Lentimicrobiaceae bacterium]
MKPQFVLYDDQIRNDLLPLTYMKPIAALRVGILTIQEKWTHWLGQPPTFLTEAYLQKKYPLQQAEHSILIHGALCPDPALVSQILALKSGEALVKGDTVLAQYISSHEFEEGQDAVLPSAEVREYTADVTMLQYPWDIFTMNAAEIHRDFAILTAGRTSLPVPAGTRVWGDQPVFIEEGAEIRGAMINAIDGPVYIGADTEIMEGSLIRGPFALCSHAQLKMGAKIYGGTTIGPYSRVGGELNNVVIQGYSNKAHDGFLGHSVIGEWCNIGADSNCSNLKNTYAEVKMWHYPSWRFINTGLQFCGLIMGDHSKCGINTMFNTGTVVGVSSNLYGSGFHRNFIPSFSWGGPQGFHLYDLDKAMQVAESVMQRRGMVFDETEREIFRYLHNHCRMFARK